MTSSYPIGVFDSGVGGLTVLREIRRELPHEDLLYVADSGHAPYGDKSKDFIESRSTAITEFLLSRGAKAIVVACNTATGAAAKLLRTRYPVPLVAMEPAVKPAVEQSRSGVVGVLATRQTLASHNFSVLLQRVGQGADIQLQPCQGLVERIESGELDSPELRTLLSHYLAPLLERGADMLVLGCTHYPYLTPLIKELAGDGLTVLDSGAAVARQVRRKLDESGLLAPPGHPGREHFWTSGQPARTQRLVSQLWGREVVVERLPEPETEKGPFSLNGLALEGI